MRVSPCMYWGWREPVGNQQVVTNGDENIIPHGGGFVCHFPWYEHQGVWSMDCPMMIQIIDKCTSTSALAFLWHAFQCRSIHSKNENSIFCPNGWCPINTIHVCSIDDCIRTTVLMSGHHPTMHRCGGKCSF